MLSLAEVENIGRGSIGGNSFVVNNGKLITVSSNFWAIEWDSYVTIVWRIRYALKFKEETRMGYDNFWSYQNEILSESH